MDRFNLRGLVAAGLAAGLLSGCAGLNLGDATTATPIVVATSQPQPTVVVAIPTTLPTALPTQPPATQQPPAPQAPAPAQGSSLPVADSEEQVIADVFNRAGPAVVRIDTGEGLGSGFLIDNDGYIITNNHVVAGANGQVLVSFANLFQTIGQVVGTDPDSDVAVVKVSELPPNVQPLELGDSNAAQVGMKVIAIGNPLGQERTVTTGIISAIGRTIAEEQSQYRIGGAIQTDAAINPGNSGGPLLNSQGKALGMNTAILSQTGLNSGIGFAVPINLIKKVAAAIISNGRYEHPYLGVNLRNVTTLQAKQNNLPSEGVLIQPSSEDSPVARGGLRGAAILKAINGQPVYSDDEVISTLEINHTPGETVTLTVITADGKQAELQVKLGARPTVTS